MVFTLVTLLTGEGVLSCKEPIGLYIRVWSCAKM